MRSTGHIYSYGDSHNIGSLKFIENRPINRLQGQHIFEKKKRL